MSQLGRRNRGHGTGGWARGRPQSPAGVTAAPPAGRSPGAASPSPVPDDVSALAVPRPATSASGLRVGLDQASALAADWAPTAGRILLGLVMLWFGYHELLLPGEWTGYVPVISESSSLAIILVLAHGWVLLVLAAALLAGIAPRAAAAVASLLMLEIVIALAATGLSDTALRDVGVLGLAVCLTGCKNQRLVLRT
ncbi:MAG TPA: hypothetical protein VME19_21430 [Streptosporangiaceae bacterium]|nr:hypothetical protein [Streptosporangiaceae bacterium]